MAMDKKTFIAALVVVWLLLSIVGVTLPEPANANFEPAEPAGATIRVYSPSQVIVYNTTSLPLNFTISMNYHGWADVYVGTIGSVFYQIDEQTFVPITVANASGNCTLPPLRNGAHNLMIWGTVNFESSPPEFKSYVENITKTVKFTVDVPVPTVSNLSIRNMLYNSTQIPLSFEVKGTISWMGYSLDNQANTTISGNTTLTELSEGVHSIEIYANDTAGNMGKSGTIHLYRHPPNPYANTSYRPRLWIDGSGWRAHSCSSNNRGYSIYFR